MDEEMDKSTIARNRGLSREDKQKIEMIKAAVNGNNHSRLISLLGLNDPRMIFSKK